MADSEKIYNRFWSKVNITANPDKCWEWQGWIHQKHKPYGIIWFEKRRQKAHRVAYRLQFGEIEKDLHVLHKCDNHKCVNPNHFFLGTNADNVADKVSKNRQARNTGWKTGVKNPFLTGSKNHQSRLTEKQVIEIRTKYKFKEYPAKRLGDEYGVSKTCVLKIVNNKLWKHI